MQQALENFKEEQLGKPRGRWVNNNRMHHKVSRVVIEGLD
jgi:hypothetical protein